MTAKIKGYTRYKDVKSDIKTQNDGSNNVGLYNGITLKLLST